MASYIINEWQTFNFSYPSAALNLTILNSPPSIGFYNNFDGTYTFQVDVAGAAGITNFTVLDNTLTPIDTITLTIIAKEPDKIVNLCLADLNSFTALPAPPSGIWNLSNIYYPSFVQFLPFGNGIVAISIAGITGEFNFLFQTTTNPLTETYLIRVIIEPCFPSYEFCSPNRVPIIWLNRTGGWSSYCFKGKKTYGVTIGNSRQFVNTQRTIQHYSRTQVYDTLGVLSGEIPVSHSNYVKSLKYAVQAYIISTIGYIPILIEEKDFTLYTDGDGLMTYNVILKYATEIKIQSQ